MSRSIHCSQQRVVIVTNMLWSFVAIVCLFLFDDCHCHHLYRIRLIDSNNQLTFEYSPDDRRPLRGIQ